MNTAKGPAHLYFNRVYTPSGVRYRISYMNNNRTSQMFEMEEKSGKWRISDLENVPAWIIRMETELSDYIFINANQHSL
ncbi:MAG TPA: hypothetical protein VGC75_03160 [Candidatus Nitrosocosmicus sp.]